MGQFTRNAVHKYPKIREHDCEAHLPGRAVVNQARFTVSALRASNPRAF